MHGYEKAAKYWPGTSSKGGRTYQVSVIIESSNPGVPSGLQKPLLLSSVVLNPLTKTFLFLVKSGIQTLLDLVVMVRLVNNQLPLANHFIGR